jgi:uncharacterized protein YjbJ (UPF0337 family)
MNWNEVAGRWNQMKGSVKEKWGKLTDDDLTMIDGKRDRLVGKIQERYGITKDLAEQQINEWRLPPSKEELMPRKKAS